MMSCSKIQRSIQAYVDGAASREQQTKVDEHVASCKQCARVLSETQRLVSLLAVGTGRKVSEGFERNLAAALQNVAPASSGRAGWERFRLHFEWRLRLPAMVAAGSLAASVIAAVVTPVYVEQARERDLRQRLVVSAVERHEQLERASPNSNWEAVDGSIDLTTGSILTE